MYNKETIKLIDDLKYKLKSREPNDRIAESLNNYLDHIINIFVLDQNSNSFASVPGQLPELLNSEYEWSKKYNNFTLKVLEWIPKEPIDINKLLARCQHNSINHSVNYPDIRYALLILRENGKIDIDQNNIISRL